MCIFDKRLPYYEILRSIDYFYKSWYSWHHTTIDNIFVVYVVKDATTPAIVRIRESPNVTRLVLMDLKDTSSNGWKKVIIIDCVQIQMVLWIGWNTCSGGCKRWMKIQEMACGKEIILSLSYIGEVNVIGQFQPIHNISFLRNSMLSFKHFVSLSTLFFLIIISSITAQHDCSWRPCHTGGYCNTTSGTCVCIDDNWGDVDCAYLSMCWSHKLIISACNKNTEYRRHRNECVCKDGWSGITCEGILVWVFHKLYSMCYRCGMFGKDGKYHWISQCNLYQWNTSEWNMALWPRNVSLWAKNIYLQSNMYLQLKFLISLAAGLLDQLPHKIYPESLIYCEKSVIANNTGNCSMTGILPW